MDRLSTPESDPNSHSVGSDPRGLSRSERESNVSLHVPRRLIRVGSADGAKPCLVWPHSVREYGAGSGIIREVQRRDGIRRTAQRQTRLPPGYLRTVRRVKHVGAELKDPAAAESDIPGDRQIQHAREAACQIVVARFE